MQQNMIEKMTEIINDFIANPQAIEFVYPYIDAYYDSVIKEKMDLTKIKEKLEMGQYQNYTTFFNDLDLIWKNCQFFNQTGSIIYKQSIYFQDLTKSLKQVFESEFNLVKKQQKKKVNKNPNQQGMQFDYKLKKKPSDEAQRLRFTHSMKNLEQDQLIKMLNIIAQHQPEALSRKDEQLIIDVTKLDSTTCEQINLL